MHGILMRVSEIDDRHCGEYKTVENNVAAFDRDGHQLGVVFETAWPLKPLVAWKS